MLKTDRVSQEVPAYPRSGGGGGQSSGWYGDWGREPTPPIANAKLMMLLAVMSSVMLFIAMTGGYIILRFGGGAWPPPGMPPLPRTLWINTGLIVVSSLSLAWAQRSVRQGRAQGLTSGLLGATLLGVAFLFGQMRVWNALQAGGVHINTGVYGSVFYLLTIMHALHVAGGLTGLSYVLLQSCRGVFTRERYVAVDVAGIFWHFVGIVWVYLFVILYLI